MAGPVEEKPFVTTVEAIYNGVRGGWELWSHGRAIALIKSDADRVEEIVRLINASVEARKPDPAARIRVSHPAFPLAATMGDLQILEGGLTKREWFAGMALAGVKTRIPAQTPQEQAREARLAADCLILELAKDQG